MSARRRTLTWTEETIAEGCAALIVVTVILVGFVVGAWR